MLANVLMAGWCWWSVSLIDPLDGAGKRPFRLGANQRQVKSAHFPGLRLACGDLFHRRANPFPIVAVAADGIHSTYPGGRVAASKTDLPACATKRLGGSAGLRPQHRPVAGAT